RILESGRLRAKCPVGEELHVTELQPLVALAGLHSHLEGGVEVETSGIADLWWRAGRGKGQRERSMRDAHQRADLEVAAIARSPERRVGAGLLERLDAGDPSLQRLLLRAHRGGVAVGLGG